MLDVRRLYRDYNIPFWEEGKNVADGWVNVRCPFCGDRSNHLGFSPQGSYVCWRCGSHKLRDVLSKLIGIGQHDFRQILSTYGTATQRRDLPEERVRIGIHKFTFPSSTGELQTQHIRYLESRKFDPDKLKRIWGLLGTGPASRLDNIDFKHRIIAPINWEGSCVSFQARDFTGKSSLRYITCPRNREIVHHKHILYGIQENWTQSGICVEGITDVWRLGVRAFATFGIEYTQQQVHKIRTAFSTVYIVFDDEPQAQRQARKLSRELSFYGVDARIVTIVGDPGSMSQSDADYLVRQCK